MSDERTRLCLRAELANAKCEAARAAAYAALGDVEWHDGHHDLARSSWHQAGYFYRQGMDYYIDAYHDPRYADDPDDAEAP